MIDGLIALIDNPDIELNELIKIIPGPDFPTAGQIYGRTGFSAYESGRGKVVMRGKADFEKSRAAVGRSLSMNCLFK